MYIIYIYIYEDCLKNTQGVNSEKSRVGGPAAWDDLNGGEEAWDIRISCGTRLMYIFPLLVEGKKER